MKEVRALDGLVNISVRQLRLFQSPLGLFLFFPSLPIPQVPISWLSATPPWDFDVGLKRLHG